MLNPKNLTCEYFTNPLGLDNRQPRLSWQSAARRRGARQVAYQITVVAAGEDFATAVPLWDSGKVASDESLHIPYAGADLQTGQRCVWRVRLWDEKDGVSPWSEPAWWEMGLLSSEEWQADWITPAWEEAASAPQVAPLLRRAFAVEGDLVAARLYVTSLGLYELHLNGRRLGDVVLTPGWTSYHHHLQYQTYDVTELLQEGENGLGVMLGDGWYRGHIGFDKQRQVYGEDLALLLQLKLEYGDGRTHTIISDKQWRAAPGPIQMSDIYLGEHYDARQEQPGWDGPGFDDSGWQPVQKLDHGKAMVGAQLGPPIVRHEEIIPAAILQSPKGETIFDLGQNMVGWVRLRVRGPAGTTITMRHAEVLDQQGNLYTENLRLADQITRFTLAGSDEAEVWEPRFTFQGFRYVAVEGLPDDPKPKMVTGIVVHSEMAQTGTFECSNPLINQLQRNIVWGQKGNFVDVPTDCPQRDERLGWTGDAQVFIRTACFNRNVASFFTKWLRDLRMEQLADGRVPYVIPDVLTLLTRRGSLKRRTAGSAAWGDAAVICPWTIYQCYGDTQLLAAQYDSMAAWVGYMARQADEDLIWRQDFHYGDWLDYRGQDPRFPMPVTNKELIATAFFAYGAYLVGQAAQVLGRQEEAQHYSALAQRVKTAFSREFVSEAGRVGPNTQTAYVLALHFDLLPAEIRPLAAARLVEEIHRADDHLATGFVGTPYLCHVLSRFGYTDVAYTLLLQETYPSWLYPVKMGATTIWERWDGIKPDGSFQVASMNSFNHYAYGAIGEWLYRVVAGLEIDPADPAYRHILVQPQPGGGMTYARALLETPYGETAVSWELTTDGFHLHVTIPANTQATVRLPAAALADVTLEGDCVTHCEAVLRATLADEVALLEIGSGSYNFVSTGLTLTEEVREAA